MKTCILWRSAASTHKEYTESGGYLRQGFGHHYREIIKMTWPAIVEFALQMVVSYVDLYMVKSLGQDATAIIGVATQVNLFVKFPIGNINIGVLAYIAKSMGEGNSCEIRKASMQAVYLALAAGLLIMGIVFLLPSPLVAILQLDPSIQQGFKEYFLLSDATLFFYVFSAVFGGAFRGIRKMKTPMLVNVGINLLNIILNYIFIYPVRTIQLFRKPVTIFGLGLGVNGAGLGTGISICIGDLLMFLLVWFDQDLSMKQYMAKPDLHILRRFIQVSIPSSLGGFINGIGRIGFTSLISAMGVTVTAANTIAFELEAICYAPVVGLMAATTTLSGNALGEGNVVRFRDNVRNIGLLSLILLTVTGTILFLVAEQASGLFSEDLKVIMLSSRMLKMISFSEPLFAMAMVFESAFQGLGDTKKPFIIDNLSMFFYRILICYFVTTIWNGGLTGAWLCMIADNMTRAIVFSILFMKKSWLKMFPNAKDLQNNTKVRESNI